MQKISTILSIINIAFVRMGLAYQAQNPMFLFVFILSCLALVDFSKQIFFQTDKIFLYGQMAFWLWMMIFFSSLIESIVLAKNPDFLHEKVRNRRLPMVKKIDSITEIDNYTKLHRTKIKAGNLILLESGDEVPFDGEVVAGMCYVSEADATGSSDNRLKSPDKDNILIAGSVIESSDRIVMKVSFATNKSFFTRVTRLLEHIDRQAMPSEMAMVRLMIGLSILFVAVIFVIWVIADYSGLAIPMMYLIDLIVILLPTTIFGLQKAIISHSQVNLAALDIKVQDQVAFDNAADINIVLLDKTGTLTIGQREMVDFTLISQDTEKDYLRYLYLSSAYDDTYEGKSIISFTAKNGKLFSKRFKASAYEHLPFSAGSPISGCNYGKLEIRKGSLKAIAQYLGKTVKTLPKEVRSAASIIAKTYGTPVVLTVNKTIIGVIHFQDRLRRGVIKSIKEIQDAGMSVVMLTGDNALTASYLAKELGIKTFYTDSTPEKKLELVRSLQKKGYVVAMIGDGVNDALALAQADIGYTFEDQGHVHAVLAGNIVAKYHDLSGLLTLKKECQKITIKRGELTVYSITSDIAKYFVIVPALFTTAFPILTNLNIMQFRSLESVIVSSLIFNALIIPSLAPLVFNNRSRIIKHKAFLWRTILLYGFGGIISPFLFIKLIEIIIYEAGLI
jgi:K+-transporting ATPase ATPase B chain